MLSRITKNIDVKNKLHLKCFLGGCVYVKIFMWKQAPVHVCVWIPVAVTSLWISGYSSVHPRKMWHYYCWKRADVLVGLAHLFCQCQALGTSLSNILFMLAGWLAILLPSAQSFASWQRMRRECVDMWWQLRMQKTWPARLMNRGCHPCRTSIPSLPRRNLVQQRWVSLGQIISESGDWDKSV